MGKKTVRMRKQDIVRLPNDKPVLYKILDKRGDNIYTGIAKRGQVRKRIEDHMAGNRDAVPSAVRVKIEQMASIDDAKKKEKAVISRSRPKYNQQGK